MTLERTVSAIYNNVVSGLKGTNMNVSIRLEQIEDQAVIERMSIIKEYSRQNLLVKSDLLLPIRCLKTDCTDIERCCVVEGDEKLIKHVEIPQIFDGLGFNAIDYFGANDMGLNFTIYTSDAWKRHKNKRRGGDKPYIWIDTTPNANNMYDVFIFNAPLLDNVTIIGIFKDPRQLLQFDCCNIGEVTNFSFISGEVEKRVTEKLIRYYRQMATAVTPSDQMIKP